MAGYFAVYAIWTRGESMHDAVEGAVRVRFPVVQDEDGYPPIDAETMWVDPLGKARGEGVLDNNPFFAVDVSCGDTVSYGESASDAGDGFVFGEVVARGGNSTVRVIAFSDEGIQRARSFCDDSGCDCEVFRNPRYISINVPSEVNYREFIDGLARMRASGDIEVEESCRQHRG